jgi:hypothetical protein
MISLENNVTGEDPGKKKKKKYLENIVFYL